MVVFSAEDDLHYRALARTAALLGLPEPKLVDLSEFPRVSHAVLDLRHGSALEVGDVVIDVAASVWWRRPQPYGLHDEVGRPTTRRFVEQECRQLVLGGLLAAAPFCVNDPELNRRAGFKPLQLRVAQDVGLTVPRTVCTNSPAAARAMAEGEDRVVYKAFTPPHRRFAETRELGNGDLADARPIERSPIILQELVEAPTDLRVTVIGKRVFAVRIEMQEGPSQLDWRLDREPKITETCLQPDLRGRLLELVDRLGLEYAAIDMRESAKGPVFLEANPAGQYLFCEVPTGLPMTEALVHLLYEPESHARLLGERPSRVPA